jgi:hypothetical protein
MLWFRYTFLRKLALRYKFERRNPSSNRQRHILKEFLAEEVRQHHWFYP